MNLTQLRIFTTVYRCESTTKAAEELHMTQPAVSRAIKELEQEYHVSLFERFNHRLCNTEAGTRFYTDAMAVLDSAAILSEDMKAAMERFRIGATFTVGTYSLPSLTAVYQKANPALTIHVRIADSASLQKELTDNRIDAALIEEKTENPQLSCQRLYTSHLRPLLPLHHPLADHKAALADIAAYPLLQREEGSSIRALTDTAFAMHELEIHSCWTSSSTIAILHAIEEGIGIAILPEETVEEALASGRFSTCEITDEPFVRSCYLVIHQRKQLTRAQDSFLAYLKTSLTAK